MENNEIEVRISDIVASFLKSIVTVAVITVVCGGLLGAYGYYKAKHTTVDTASIQTTIDTTQESIDAKNLSIRNLETKNQTLENISIPYYNRKIERDTTLLEKRRTYLDDSIYYTIDPFNCGTARITFAVETQIPEQAYEQYADYLSNEQRLIANVCAALNPFSDTVLEKVRTILGEDVEPRFVEELISVTKIDNQLVRLDVYYQDPALAQEACDYLFSEIEKLLAEMSPAYKIKVVNTFNGFEVNWNMYNQRTSYEDSLLSTEKNLSSDSEALSNLNKNFEDNTNSINVTNEEISKLTEELERAKNNLAHAQDVRSGKKAVIKFGMIGLIIGFVLACGFVYVREILSGKIRNRFGVISRFPYPILGVVPSSKKYIFGKTIKKLEGDSLSADSEVIAATAASTLALVAAEGTDCCMIGTIAKDDPSLAALKDAMNGKVKFAGNILSDAKAVASLEKSQAIVLVEKRNESRVDSISEEITKINSLKKEILGIILL